MRIRKEFQGYVAQVVKLSPGLRPKLLHYCTIQIAPQNFIDIALLLYMYFIVVDIANVFIIITIITDKSMVVFNVDLYY